MHLKNQIKKIINVFGFALIQKKHYDALTNFNQLSFLDNNYIFNNYFNKKDSILCFDIGANIGQTALKFNKKFQNSCIYCFEPIKNTFEKLVCNVQNCDNIKTYNFAFGSEEGEIKVFHQSDDRWNSLNERANTTQKNNLTLTSEIVKVEKVDTFVTKNNISEINILKTDTEGFELNVLKGAKECLEIKKIDFIYVEVGFDINDVSHTHWLEVFNFLEKYEYLFLGFFELCYNRNKSLHYANALFASNSALN
ncbi:MAG: FkbM family methyltransferase [Bacteroidales bacterium]